MGTKRLLAFAEPARLCSSGESGNLEVQSQVLATWALGGLRTERCLPPENRWGGKRASTEDLHLLSQTGSALKVTSCGVCMYGQKKNVSRGRIPTVLHEVKFMRGQSRGKPVASQRLFWPLRSLFGSTRQACAARDPKSFGGQSCLEKLWDIEQGTWQSPGRSSLAVPPQGLITKLLWSSCPAHPVPSRECTWRDLEGGVVAWRC